MTQWLKAAMAAAFLGVPIVAAAEVPWTVLDRRGINSESGDLQVIGVATGQRFNSLRLCVTQQPILLRQVEVRFRDGGSRTYHIRATLQNLRCTGDIILPGGARRALAEVAVYYNAAGLSRRGVRLQLHAR